MTVERTARAGAAFTLLPANLLRLTASNCSKYVAGSEYTSYTRGDSSSQQFQCGASRPVPGEHARKLIETVPVHRQTPNSPRARRSPILTETRAHAIREQSNLPVNVSRSSEMQWGKGSAFVLIGGIGDDRRYAGLGTTPGETQCALRGVNLARTKLSRRDDESNYFGPVYTTSNKIRSGEWNMME